MAIPDPILKLAKAEEGLVSTIAREWEIYKKANVPPAMTEAEVAERRRIFYSGCQHAMLLVVRAQLFQGAALRPIVDGIVNELWRFSIDVRAGKA